jgi:hypothetical protein
MVIWTIKVISGQERQVKPTMIHCNVSRFVKNIKISLQGRGKKRL